MLSIGPQILQTQELCPEENILGSIVENMYNFVGSREPLRETYYDLVKGEEVLGKEYFDVNRSFVQVKQGRLPLEINTKAVYMHKEGSRRNIPYVQTARVDYDFLSDKLEDRLDLTRLKGRQVMKHGKALVRFRNITPLYGGASHPRTNITFPRWDGVSEKSWRVAESIRVANLMYNNNTFLEDSSLKVDLSDVSSSTPKMELKQIQNMRQQQLILSEQRMVGQMSQNQYMGMRFGEVIKQDSSDLAMQAVDSQEEIAELALPKVRRKAISRIIKASEGKLSWKGATKIYYNLLKRGAF